VGCSFCGFGRGHWRGRRLFPFFEEVVRRSREAWERGATEVCVQGGLPRDLDGFFYRDLLRAIKHAIPEMHVHAFSPMEIDYGVTKTGMALRDYLRMMKDEGLGSIPGTAAEILDDRVRKELSPNKLPAARWVEIITCSARTGHSDDFNHDVRTRGRARGLGAAHAPLARDAKNAPVDLPSSSRWDSSTRIRGSTVMVERGREQNGKSICECTHWRECCCTGRSRICKYPG